MSALIEVSSASTGSLPVRSERIASASYTIRSAVDFLPSSITLLMTCWTSFERWIASGSIGRWVAAARRGTYFAFTPYWERAFLRSETPAASSVPRTTL